MEGSPGEVPGKGKTLMGFEDALWIFVEEIYVCLRFI